jgi:hypothetical protein
MSKTAGNILKGEDVKLEGQFHLHVAQGESAGQGPKQNGTAMSAPQVRIVQKHPDFALLEITCSCGLKTNVKCEYPGPQTPEETDTDNGQAGVPDQMTKKSQNNGENQNAS